jgi:hypothetical protein
LLGHGRLVSSRIWEVEVAFRCTHHGLFACGLGVRRSIANPRCSCITASAGRCGGAQHGSGGCATAAATGACRWPQQVCDERELRSNRDSQEQKVVMLPVPAVVCHPFCCRWAGLRWHGMAVGIFTNRNLKKGKDPRPPLLLLLLLSQGLGRLGSLFHITL